MRKALQKLKPSDLQPELTPTQIAEFLESFQKVALASGAGSETKLISIKIPKDLLITFRTKAAQEGIKYQTKIKELMRDYVMKG